MRAFYSTIVLIIFITLILSYSILVYRYTEYEAVIADIRIIEGYIDLIKYKPSNNSAKFTPYLSRDNIDSKCQESVYKISRHQCCAVQFAMNYLYSLGFTNITGIQRSSNTKTMRNYNESIIGCYGLNIEQRTSKHAEIFRQPLAMKTKSYTNIMKYCSKYNITKYCKEWLPVSYNLKIREERMEFFQHLTCSNGPNGDWLLKSDVHSGSGIYMIDNVNHLRHFYLSKTEQMEVDPLCITTDDGNETRHLPKNVVAQQLVSDILKIKECNFHVRSWMLLANYYKPSIVLYIDSFITRATDPNKIITNRHNREWNNEDNWSMKQFREYFNGTLNVDRVINDIKNVTKVLFRTAFDSREHELVATQEANTQHYVLLALDFLVTTDHEVKFLDFNTAPGSSFVPKKCFAAEYVDVWQCAFGRKMMEEIVDIQLEIAIKKKNGQHIDEIDSISAFEDVLWE